LVDRSDPLGERLRGRQPKLNPAQEKHLVELWRAGQHTTGELAELFGIARSTVYRAVQRAEQARTTRRAATSEASRAFGQSPPQRE